MNPFILEVDQNLVLLDNRAEGRTPSKMTYPVEGCFTDVSRLEKLLREEKEG